MGVGTGRVLLLAIVGLGPSARPAAAGPREPEGVLETVRVENGGFPSSLRAWTLGSSGAVTAATWSAGGATSESPGSAWLTHSTNGIAALAQCIVDVLPGQTYTASASWFAPSGQALNADGGSVALEIGFFTGRACDSGFLPAEVEPGVDFGPGGNGGWQTLTNTRTTLGARSLLVLLRHTRRMGQPPGTSGVYFDEVSLTGPFGFVKGDFDRGGETDLLLRNTVGNVHRAWLLNDEVLSMDLDVFPQPTAPWQAAGVDDFDANEKNDLLMWHPANGWLDFWFMNGTTRIGNAVPISEDPGPDWKPSATADFDHDGKPDIVLRNPTTQLIKIWTMNGTAHTGTLTPSPDHAVDANWEIVGAADIDGDGNRDFLWYNATSGRIVYWLMNATVVRTLGAFTNPMAAGANNWKVLAMGDYGIGPSTTGTGLPGTQDIVWRNATSGRLVVWYMDRAGNRTSGLFVQPDPPAPATDWTIAGPR